MDKQQSMLSHYSSDWAYEKYSDIGLWEPEELLIRKYISQGSKILEVGCGGGRATIPLKKLGYEIIGIDVVPRMVELARKNVRANNMNVDILLMDASALKFEDSSFDAVLFLYNGIESVPGELKRNFILKEIHRVLKQSGTFIMVTQSVFNREGIGLYFRKIMNVLSKNLTFGKYALFRYLTRLKFGESVVWVNGQPSFSVKVTNPLHMIYKLKRSGYGLHYINSRKRIEQGKIDSIFSIWTNRTLFYVLKKR